MTLRRVVKCVGAVATIAAMALAGMLISSRRVQAHEEDERDEARIRRGFEIAPVPLKLEGKNRALVGLGS